jgi:branched-chain amino acid transport system substrate-binding protein
VLGSRHRHPARAPTIMKSASRCALRLLTGPGLVLFAACANAPLEPPPIRIGLLALMEGLARETSGRPSIEGAELAVEIANRQGGVLVGRERRKVELVIRPYDDRPDSATGAARALINQDRIDALVGPQFSRHAIAVAPIAESAHLPMVSPMSSNPATTAGKRFVFRLAAQDAEQAAAMARFAAAELGATRAAVLYDVSTHYGRSLAEAFKQDFEDAGGSVVAFETFVKDAPLTHAEQLGRIAAAAPHVLFLPSEIDRVLPQIAETRRLGIEAVLLGSDTWDSKSMLESPETDGAYYAHQWHHDLPFEESHRFVELYESAHGEVPRATAAMTYDGVRLLLDAFEQAASTEPDAVREALGEPRTFAGVAGAMVFEGSPDPRRAVMVSRIRGGRSELVEQFP